MLQQCHLGVNLHSDTNWWGVKNRLHLDSRHLSKSIRATRLHRDWTRPSLSHILVSTLLQTNCQPPKKLTLPDSSTELFEIITAITVQSVKSPGTFFWRDFSKYSRILNGTRACNVLFGNRLEPFPFLRQSVRIHHWIARRHIQVRFCFIPVPHEYFFAFPYFCRVFNFLNYQHIRYAWMGPFWP